MFQFLFILFIYNYVVEYNPMTQQQQKGLSQISYQNALNLFMPFNLLVILMANQLILCSFIFYWFYIMFD